ncbi:metal transporter CNNM3 isoform X2 [Rhinatrema bivittatum]|uniref:metal transporter CNNM3 isoform X2 n=1 Tax=Rhinatrema bivittatum TaxID=194408 RepID=UPI00112D5B97|nr:metal transporter CNNM3 isoform X2 [Rhinatrema bivittatum]
MATLGQGTGLLPLVRGSLLLLLLLSRDCAGTVTGTKAPPEEKPPPPPPPLRLLGLRLEEPGGPGASMSGSEIHALPGAAFRLRLYGDGLRNASGPWLGFALVGASCSPPPRSGAPLWLQDEVAPAGPHSALVTVRVREGGGSDGRDRLYRLCSRVGPGEHWEPYAGDDTVLRVLGEGGRAPLAPWLLALLIALLVALSAALRGLQLAALWLDPLELCVLQDCGTQAERAAAKQLALIRRCGSFALCALLLLAALANAAVAVLLYLVLEGAAPAIFASAGLVFLVAEVLPYALSSRWGFVLAPRTVWATQFFMVLTFLLSFPLSKLLTLVFGHDISTCYIREKVVDMVRCSDPYNEFVKEEFSKGALRTKTVEDILTPVKDCFMLSSNAMLDFSRMSEIMQSGYTRIPVYEEDRSNIVDIVYVKDLAMVDPDDCTPLSTITKFYNHPLHFVFNDTKLDAVLEEFKRGKSHMAIVQKVNNEGEGDPFYEVLGLVTLEDVIEEIIKSEILDESDGYKDNKARRKPASLGTTWERNKEDFSLFKVSDVEHKVKISPQLLLATQRFLSREVDVFNISRISETVLLHLLKHPSVNHEVKFDEGNRLAPEHYLYQRNQPVDYFVLILQGRVEVEIGKEGLKFENGAFTYYGVSALTAPSSVHQSPVATLRLNRRDQVDTADNINYSLYCPDYTVRALTDLQLIKVTKLQYLNALMASRVHTSPQSPESIELKVLPNSQTKLLNEKNSAAAFPVNISVFGAIENYS